MPVSVDHDPHTEVDGIFRVAPGLGDGLVLLGLHRGLRTGSDVLADVVRQGLHVQAEASLDVLDIAELVSNVYPND